MQTKSQILKRKLLHIGLLIPMFIFWGLMIVWDQPLIGKIGILVVLQAFLIYEYVRLDLKMPIIFHTLVKPQEVERPVDGVNLLLACLVIHLLVPLDIAVAVTLVAILGDAASTLGGLYGTMKIFKNSDIKTTWEGAFFTIIVNCILTFSVLGVSATAIVIALSAVIIETTVQKLDDNLAVPIIVGGIGWLTQWISNL